MTKCLTTLGLALLFSVLPWHLLSAQGAAYHDGEVTQLAGFQLDQDGNLSAIIDSYSCHPNSGEVTAKRMSFVMNNSEHFATSVISQQYTNEKCAPQFLFVNAALSPPRLLAHTGLQQYEVSQNNIVFTRNPFTVTGSETSRPFFKLSVAAQQEGDCGSSIELTTDNKSYKVPQILFKILHKHRCNQILRPLLVAQPASYLFTGAPRKSHSSNAFFILFILLNHGENGESQLLGKFVH